MPPRPVRRLPETLPANDRRYIADPEPPPAAEPTAFVFEAGVPKQAVDAPMGAPASKAVREAG